jgi:hypothetical protein
MPPGRSARVAELQQPQALLGPLEGDFAKAFLGRLLRSLPLDERLRAREVSRGWRLFLNDASFWTHVDLGKSCGVNPRFLSTLHRALPLLRTACVRATGSLQSVDLSGVGYIGGESLRQWAEASSAANKASLRDLVTFDWLDVEQAAALCRALPLCRVRCGVEGNAVEALPLLRRKPPYELLTIGKLHVYKNEDGGLAVLDLASTLSVYKGVEKLTLSYVPLTTRAVRDALVNAAISAGIKDMCFDECGLSQTALPALTRLLQSPGFEGLTVWNRTHALLEGPALPAFCEALRNSKSLKMLKLKAVNLWADVAAASQLIAAMEGHPALQELSTEFNRTYGTPDTQRAAGECLSRLIAHSTSLKFVDVSYSELGEAGMTPIFEALRGSTVLEVLSFGCIDALFSAEFARNVLLPAVRANTSLRRLFGFRSVDGEPLPALREVEVILEARRLADADAA